MSRSKAVATTPSSPSSFNATAFGFKFNSTGARVALVTAVLIGAAAIVYVAKAYTSTARDTNSVKASGSDNVSSGAGNVNVNRDNSGNTAGSAISHDGTATVTHQDVTSTVSGDHNTTLTGGHDVQATVPAEPFIKEADKGQDFERVTGTAWKNDSAGSASVQFPFTIDRQTKVSPPLSCGIFTGNRRAIIELAGVKPDWIGHFGVQMKSVREWGDGNRQAEAVGVGKEFVILRGMDGDKAFYLAWRGDVTREKFLEANSDATITIRLLN